MHILTAKNKKNMTELKLEKQYLYILFHNS